MTARPKPGPRLARDTAGDRAKTIAAPASLSPPKSLSPEEAELFRKLVASKPASYWRDSDSHLLERYVTLWSRAAKVSEDARSARPCTVEGRPNPIFALEARLYRQAELLLRSLGLTPFQRLENRGNASAREAKREDERARVVETAMASAGKMPDGSPAPGLLASPMH